MIRKYKEKRLVSETSDADWLQFGTHAQTLPLVVAPEDYVDPETGKRYFTWCEIMKLQQDGKLPEGWRLPTKDEAQGLIDEFGANPEARMTPSAALMERLGLTPNGWIIPSRLELYSNELELSDYATARGGASGLCAYWTDTVDAAREEHYMTHGYRKGDVNSFYTPNALGRYAYVLAATRFGRLEVAPFPADHGLTVRLVHSI